MPTFINVKDYDKIKKGEKIEIVVEAKNRSPMLVCVYKGVPTSDNDYSGYENAISNRESHQRSDNRMKEILLVAMDHKQRDEWMYHMPMEEFGPINFNAVERALGFRLFAWQKSYILFGEYRKSGETTAHILKDLLTDIDSKPLDYSNLARMDHRGRIYVQQTRDIWEKLLDAKIKMRPVFWNKRDKEMYEKQI